MLGVERARGRGLPARRVGQRILQAATGAQSLSSSERREVLAHVARAGFDPAALEQVRGRGAGQVWAGRALLASDRLPPAEAHYVRHVLVGREWPTGTTLQQYVDSLRWLILDPASGAFTSRYAGSWQLGVVRRSGPLRGPEGHAWVLVEYRLATGHWVTGYQPAQGLRELRTPARQEMRWLHRPT